MSKIQVDSFLSTKDHLNMVAQLKYGYEYENLSLPHKDEVFKQFREERIAEYHINDKWKKYYD